LNAKTTFYKFVLSCHISKCKYIQVCSSGSQTGCHDTFVCRELRQRVSPNNPMISFCRERHMSVTNIETFCHVKVSPKIDCQKMCRHSKKVVNHCSTAIAILKVPISHMISVVQSSLSPEALQCSSAKFLTYIIPFSV
jgi:hypothetical protein